MNQEVAAIVVAGIHRGSRGSRCVRAVGLYAVF
jgi:hypothetical protein